MLPIGTKFQVYSGYAEKTSGGLKKKDICKVVDKNGISRYKSKKNRIQKSKLAWTRAYKKAIDFMQEIDKYYKTNILMFKPDKKYIGYTKIQLEKGVALYTKTIEFYRVKK